MEGNNDVWLIDVGRGVPNRLTFDAGLDSGPIWSPDDSQIVFRSTRKGNYDLFQKAASGTVEDQPLLFTSENKSPLDWSHDGRFLLYSTHNPNAASDIWALPMMGEQKPFAVLQSSFDEIQGQFSPDGRWLAYSSNESGRYEIYVRTFPEVGGKWLVSAAGGVQPRWRRDGRELFYVAPLLAEKFNLDAVGKARPKGDAVSQFLAKEIANTNQETDAERYRVLVALLESRSQKGAAT